MSKLKYYNYAVTFSEIPDEVCLYITLTNCPNHCPECNSPWLAEDIGTELTWNGLNRLIDENKGITCVVFGGGDGNISELSEQIINIFLKKEGIKIAFYSGSTDINLDLCNYLDYYKIGPYSSQHGPLNNPMTNQRLYRIVHGTNRAICLRDITNKFWK